MSGPGEISMAESVFLSHDPASPFATQERTQTRSTHAETLSAAVLDIQVRSVAAYLRRQQLEAQRQQLQQATILCEQELIALDGELKAVTALQKAAV